MSESEHQRDDRWTDEYTVECPCCFGKKYIFWEFGDASIGVGTQASPCCHCGTMGRVRLDSMSDNRRE